MGKASRDKGARGELEVAALFTAAGFPVHRTPNSGGLHIPGDLVGDTGGLHIETKRTERLDLWGALAQASADVLKITPVPEPIPVPVVCFRRSRSDWHAALRLHDLLQLLKEARG